MKSILWSLSLWSATAAFAQTGTPADTAHLLKPVTVNAYFSEQPLLDVPASITVLNKQQLNEQQPYSLLPALNSVAGVRMEERSPGSYRLSIRGSLLRSPYGVRNIKIYLDDFMLTDAGGNTYLNSLDPGAPETLEILKGPEASIFGANTGGALLIHLTPADSSMKILSLTAGSYGMFREHTSGVAQSGRVRLSFNQSYLRSDGYRRNSAMERKYIHFYPQWAYSSRAVMKGLFLYSDMNYETPGGLTSEQFAENPRQARPASGPIPGAEEQKAGIKNKIAMGGLSHQYSFSEVFRHVIAFSGSYTDFKNPFITNYEMRNESTVGVRTYVEAKSKPASPFSVAGQVGLELQETSSRISNYGNRQGLPDSLQAASRLIAAQKFIFAHLAVHLRARFLLETAASINFYHYDYGERNDSKSSLARNDFHHQLMPRVAMSYLLNDKLSFRASLSRGYSPPTIAEVRASDNLINTRLQAETGWNYEAGTRLSLFNNRFYWDAVIFHYSLRDAIVRRLNEDGTEYFTNAGGTRQTGLESQLMMWLLTPSSSRWLTSLRMSNSYTFSAFFFKNYFDGSANYSGNRLTGVPRHAVVSSAAMAFANGLALAVQHNYSSPISLDDAATAYAKSYHLVQVKASVSKKKNQKSSLTVYVGIDNLLNERYSLGNDLNAYGARYFNAAPPRNFFAGMNIAL